LATQLPVSRKHFIHLTGSGTDLEVFRRLASRSAALNPGNEALIRFLGLEHAGALKVSWALLPAESADQDFWKPLRGKLTQVSVVVVPLPKFRQWVPFNCGGESRYD